MYGALYTHYVVDDGRGYQRFGVVFYFYESNDDDDRQISTPIISALSHLGARSNHLISTLRSIHFLQMIPTRHYQDRLKTFQNGAFNIQYLGSLTSFLALFLVFTEYA